MTRGARHEQVNHAFGFGRKVWLMSGQRIVALRSRRRASTTAQQLAQRNRSQPDATFLQEPTARKRLAVAGAIQRVLTIHRSVQSRSESLKSKNILDFEQE